jgi:hypothetical protein
MTNFAGTNLQGPISLPASQQPSTTYSNSTQQTAANQLQTAPQLPGALNTTQAYAPTLFNPSSLAQVQATTYGGTPTPQTATVNPNQVQQIAQSNTPDLSANATITQILQAFQPQQRTAQAQLQDQLAASGLSGGPALAAQDNLQTQLTQALAPTLASAIQQSQSNQLQSGQFDTTQLVNTLNNNMSALNSNNQLGAQLQQQTGLANMDALNTANTTNAGAANSVNAANVSAQNQSQQQYLSALLQQYQNQFAAFNSINDAGLSTQNTISANGANNFGTAASDPFSGLGASFSSLFAPTAKSTPATTSA